VKKEEKKREEKILLNAGGNHFLKRKCLSPRPPSTKNFNSGGG
jgi:hypothetical protein